MIFISYSSMNGHEAGELKRELEANYYPCFLAHDDIGGGADWQDEIWKALTGCQAFVALVTDEFNASQFCQQEIGAALALSKPRLLLLAGAKRPPGFAARFQAVKQDKLLPTLNESPDFRKLRTEAWVKATREVPSFAKANAIHHRFFQEWKAMQDEEKLQWFLAAASNGQVSGEGYTAGPFYKRALRELKPLLTDQWLYENDTRGVLHDFDSNPIGASAK